MKKALIRYQRLEQSIRDANKRVGEALYELAWVSLWRDMSARRRAFSRDDLVMVHLALRGAKRAGAWAEKVNDAPLRYWFLTDARPAATKKPKTRSR